MWRHCIALAFALCWLVSPLVAAEGKPINVLIITGDHGHNWKETTPFLKDLLSKAGMNVAVTATPAQDLTSENLSRYDVLLLNYKDTSRGTPESRWSAENQQAFADAVEGGTGLVVYHHASSAFTSGDAWRQRFEQLTAGGWRKQGNHGKRHEFDVTVTAADHPITRGIEGTYPHSNDELYQNSMVFPDNTLLVTAWSDKNKDPKNTDKDEPMVWVAMRGKGRVVQNALGHDVPAMGSPIFQTLMVRCVEWAATGEVKSQPSAELKKKS